MHVAVSLLEALDGAITALMDSDLTDGCDFASAVRDIVFPPDGNVLPAEEMANALEAVIAANQPE